MDKYTINNIRQEYGGKEYEFPIGVLARNVETDAEHQFVTKKEKEKIGEIDTIKQSFQDGCNTLVSACTTYGATPASNSPAHISAAIAKIYTDRYNAGRIQGRNDVIANPGKYGIDQIRQIYQHQTSTRRFNNVSHSESVTAIWNSFDHSDVVEYQIPLDNNKMLYGVAFDLEYYAIRATVYNGECTVAYTYSLKTVEGTVIQSDSISPVTTGTTENFGTVTRNIMIDLLQKAFATNGDHVILKLEYSMTGRVVTAQDQISGASISFSNIQAKYK